MSWWEVLGVEQNAELRSIKRAYASLIKHYRPETHPEEFSEIRQAYEYARNCCQQSCTVDIEPPQIDEFIELDSDELDYANVGESLTTANEYDDFLQILKTWVANGFHHDESFNRLLMHDIHQDWFGFQQASTLVFEQLLESICIASGMLSTKLNIDGRQLAELDQLYRWRQEEIQLHQSYDHENVGLLFYGIELGYGVLPEAEVSSVRISGTRRNFVFRELFKCLVALIVVLSAIFWVFSE